MKNLFTTIVAFLMAHAAFACSASFTSSTSAVNNNLLLLNYTETSVSGTLPPGHHMQNIIYFGDGSSALTYGNSTSSHNYSAPGTYTVKLVTSIVDSFGGSLTCTDSVTHTVSMSYPPCASSFSSVNGAAGSVTFTAVNPGGASGLIYYWTFGDGTTAYGNPITHTYSSNGTYTVTMYDSNATCSYVNHGSVTVSNSSTGTSCAGAHAAFTAAASGLTANFTNTSTNTSPSASVSNVSWSFGDGTSNATFSPAHTYAAAGIYSVKLIMTWHDSMTLNYCTDTTIHSVTVTSGGGTSVNKITGIVMWDSSAVGNPLSPAYKVWLIKYDTATLTLSAVDSVNLIGPYSYTFSNKPAGAYRVKAALTNGPTSGTASVPTYGFDSLYWHGAHVINYSGTGINSGNNIMMRNGTVTSGPGFIGGSVLAGANKGTQTTGVPVANLTMFLENMSGTPIAYTTTDANGAYNFSNFPVGTYQVYPEGLGYVTTPAQVTAGTTQTNHVDFTQHTVSKTITPGTTGIVNVTASAASFTVFPNPGNGLFNISWAASTAPKAVHAVVSDVVGHKVFETDLNMATATGYTQVNIASLQPGVYFIALKAEGVSYTSKVVLQH